MSQTRLFYSFQCHGKWDYFLNVYVSLISIYIVEYYSAIKKKNENLPCATWMDFEGIMFKWKKLEDKYMRNQEKKFIDS